MINQKYIEQVKLLLEVLPIISHEKLFALKGGTAITMFYNNLPRLSVDIDLVYTIIENRDAYFLCSLKESRSIFRYALAKFLEKRERILDLNLWVIILEF